MSTPFRTLALIGKYQSPDVAESVLSIARFLRDRGLAVLIEQGTASSIGGAHDFPVGTTLVKTFAYPADFRRPSEKVRYLETRLLIRQAQGWTALAYVWNEAQDEARLKRAGTRLDISFVDAHGQPRRIDYAVPNANQCKECHSLSGELAPIGPKARNLNGDFAYSAGTENQLAHWARTGLLSGAPPPSQAPRTAAWDDPAAPLADRARAYLDANCGHCHNAAGMASNSGLNLDLEETRLQALSEQP